MPSQGVLNLGWMSLNTDGNWYYFGIRNSLPILKNFQSRKVRSFIRSQLTVLSHMQAVILTTELRAKSLTLNLTLPCP